MANQLGKKIEGFPQTQTEMAEWQQKHIFSAGSWYEKAVEAPVEETPIAPTKEGGDLVIEDQTGETPSVTNAKSRLDFYAAQVAAAEKAQAEARAEREKVAAKTEKEEETWWQKLLAKPTTAEKRAEEFEEIGIKPAEYFETRKADIAEVGSLMASYDTRKAQMDVALLGVEERLAGYPGGIMRGEKALLQKQQNIELSQMSAGIKTKLAIMEMKQGNFEQARSFVREAVSDYVFDLKLEYSQFEKFREDNQDKIGELDKEYKDALDKAENYALAAWQEEEDRATKVGDLMLNYPEADITFDDDVQEAQKKASEWQAAQPEKVTEYAPTQMEKEWSAAGGQAGTGMSLFEYIGWRSGAGEGMARDWADEEFRIAIRAMRGQNKSYQDTLDEIALDTTIKNKARARLIASELFGVAEAEPEFLQEIPEKAKESIIGPKATYISPIPESTTSLFE